MFLNLNDGRKDLYQWDIGRKASVSVDCDEVHFAHLNYADSLPVKVVDGEVEIPNQLLTVAMPLLCWAFVEDADGHYTKQAQTLEVLRRAKPADYLYTPTEVISVKDAVNQGLEEAKASGEFDGEKGEKGDKGDKGEDGKSAYEIAVESGKFEGTEEEWLEYLEGAQSQKVNEALQSALNGIADVTASAHEGIDSHLGYALSEISYARGQSMEEIHNAKQEAVDAIAKNIVQTTGVDETVVMSQKASSNAFANALKGTASGEAIAITDASPIEHEMGVRVSGVSDISTVKVKKYGKNLLGAVGAPMFGNISNSDDIKHERTDTGLKYIGLKDATITTQRVGYQVVPIETLKGKTLTISFKRYSQADDTNTSTCALLQAADAELTDDYTYVGGNLTNRLNYRELKLKHAANGYFSYTLTIPENETRKNLFIVFYAGSGAVVSQGDVIEYTDIQVELGNAATEYEAFNGMDEYPVSTDGTVEGVTPIYPTTTLMTDTAGAVMDCTYNRDINKAFAELQSIVNTLVGG